MFDAVSTDLVGECKKMDAIIAAKGGIDLMIVGIGMNGHIGFNEPGVDFNLLSHIIELDETTKTVGQKYFQTAMKLERGITLGLAHLMSSKKVLLLANGESKAAVIQQAAEGPVTSQFPASIMQQHDNGLILVDEKAAAVLKR
jgi:6-phosphogluconolactonase/glucosamine-6-phosphate isomerase/deaminase